MAKFGSRERVRDDSAAGAAGTSDRSYDIRIARDGTWYYRGSPINRTALVKLFASVLRRDDSGGYWLITPAERGRIEVDDAPFTAVAVTAAGSGSSQTLIFRTNLDREITAGPEHPIRVAFDPGTGEPSPYILIVSGLEALIVRSVYYQLADLAVEHEGRLGIWSQQTFFAMDQSPTEPTQPQAAATQCPPWRRSIAAN